MLLRLLRSSRQGRGPASAAPTLSLDPAQRYFLNVGGASKSFPVPAHYAGWGHVLLDIDPRSKADLLLDARRLGELEPGQFDAVYCSHNLEHYHAHEVPRVLGGFAHVLKPNGFVEIRVPDLAAVAREMAAGRDMEDSLYTSPAGPISVRDVLYGFGREIESGGDFYAHKTGFTTRSLVAALTRAGFAWVYAGPTAQPFDLRAIALRAPPDDYTRALLDIDR